MGLSTQLDEPGRIPQTKVVAKIERIDMERASEHKLVLIFHTKSKVRQLTSVQPEHLLRLLAVPSHP